MLLLRLHEIHLLLAILCGLSRIWRRRDLMVRSIHSVVIVVWVRLTVWILAGSILIHLHVRVGSVLCGLCLLYGHDLLLLLLLTLPTHALVLLLFLYTRCWGSA